MADNEGDVEFAGGTIGGSENVAYVQTLESFFEEAYKKKIEELSEFYPDKRSILVDFKDVEKFDPELADELLDNPEVILKAGKEAIANLGIKNASGDLVVPNIRIINLPQDRNKLVRDLTSVYLNKLVSVEGVITKITDVRPKLHVAVFQCKHCGRMYNIPQEDELYGKLTAPGVCACGRKDYKLLLENSTFIDMQKMQIQEPLEALVRGEQAKTIDVWLEDDLTRTLYPGDKIIVTGVLKLIPPKKKDTSVYGVYLKAISVQKKEKEFEEIEITPEEEEEIRKLANDPNIYEKLVRSIAPSIYGHEKVKEAIALQLFGGTKNKVFPDGTRVRPDIHILLIGDPGTAKSQMLYYVYKLAPKAVFVGGKSSTGAGLTATAEKDEFGEGGWTLKAGALVLASGGHAMIDEFDKMNPEDRDNIHEAMEQQRVSIAKAGIVTQFKTETSILAAANPKFGRFDPYQPPAEQFNIPPTILSRFDLIFPIRDILDTTRDKKMANHILTAHQVAGIINTKVEGIKDEEEVKKRVEEITPEIPPEFLTKYIAYARKHVNPVLTDEAIEKIQEYYTELRSLGSQQDTVPITARQLEALVRLAEASAKARLSDRVLLEDAERAVALHEAMMKEVGVDRKTGKLDYDIIATGQPKSKMEKAKTLLNIIKELQKHFDAVDLDKIKEEAKTAGIDEDEISDLLNILKKNGDVYSPRNGLYKTLEEE